MSPAPSDKAVKRPKRSSALIGSYVVYSQNGEVCFRSTRSHEVTRLKLEQRVREVVDIDFNKDIIAILDSDGLLLVLKYLIRENGGRSLFGSAIYQQTSLDQICLSKSSNVLYGSRDFEYFACFDDPTTNLTTLTEKLNVPRPLVAPDGESRMVYTVAELDRGLSHVALFARSSGSLQSLICVSPGDGVPLALLYLPAVRGLLAITTKSVTLMDCVTMKEVVKPCTSITERPILVDVPEENFVVCVANGTISTIEYGALAVRPIEELDRRTAPLGAEVRVEKTMDSAHVRIAYEDGGCSEHTFSLSSANAVAMPAALFEAEVEEPKEEGEADAWARLEEGYNKMVDKWAEEAEGKIAQEVAARVEGRLTTLISQDVEAHMKKIEEGVAANVQGYVDKCLDPEKLQAQINAVGNSLQENMSFTLQRSFVPMFEESCNRMFKELAKTYKDGYSVFKQKLDSEDAAIKEVKTLEDAGIKRSIDFANRLQGVIEQQVETARVTEEFARAKTEDLLAAGRPAVIAAEQREEAKPEPEPEPSPAPVAAAPEPAQPRQIDELFSGATSEPQTGSIMKPRQQITPGKPLLRPDMPDKSPRQAAVEEFKTALRARDARQAIEIAAGHQFVPNALLEFLDSFDDSVLAELAGWEQFPRLYVANSLRAILNFLMRSPTTVDRKYAELMGKAKQLVTASGVEYQEYREIYSMLASLDQLVKQH